MIFVAICSPKLDRRSLTSPLQMLLTVVGVMITRVVIAVELRLALVLLTAENRGYRDDRGDRGDRRADRYGTDRRDDRRDGDYT
jgi:hypothetical protein